MGLLIEANSNSNQRSNFHPPCPRHWNGVESKANFNSDHLIFNHRFVGMGMGLVSEATAVELGIQTREDGEARVGITMMT